MPRGARTATAAVVATLATAICAFAAVQAISLAARGRTLGFDVHEVTRYARTTSWNDTAVAITAIVAGAVGLGLLLVAVIPARRRLSELHADDPRVAVGLAGLHPLLLAAVLDVEGVRRARVRGRHRVTITAGTTLRDTTGLAEAVRAAAASRLDALDLQRPPTLRVRLNRKQR